ncbi:MAG TPA: ribosomal protein S18-alanine N-acetyltransferase [Acidobacteriaceae bacterium]|jgi:ribosomal-protein-alanine N-acetyltransferase
MRSDPRADIVIRPATATDVPAILAIEQVSAGAPHWPAARYAEMLADDPGSLQKRALLVAEIGGDIAGYAVAMVVAEDAELESIAVSPAFRRQGVGLRLGEALLDWAIAQGAAEIYLEVRATNLAAYLLYEWLGFYKTGIRKSYYDNPLEDAVLMTCHIRDQRSEKRDQRLENREQGAGNKGM